MEKDMGKASSGIKDLNVSSRVNGKMINLPDTARSNAKMGANKRGDL